MLTDDVALSLTPYLKEEKEYVPWMSALDNLVYFATQFSTYDSVNGSTNYYSTYKVTYGCYTYVFVSHTASLRKS